MVGLYLILVGSSGIQALAFTTLFDNCKIILLKITISLIQGVLKQFLVEVTFSLSDHNSIFPTTDFGCFFTVFANFLKS